METFSLTLYQYSLTIRSIALTKFKHIWNLKWGLLTCCWWCGQKEAFKELLVSKVLPGGSSYRLSMLYRKLVKLYFKEEKRCVETLVLNWKPWSICNAIDLRQVSTDSNYRKPLLISAKTIMYCNRLWLWEAVWTIFRCTDSTLCDLWGVQNWTGRFVDICLQPNIRKWLQGSLFINLFFTNYKIFIQASD